MFINYKKNYNRRKKNLLLYKLLCISQLIERLKKLLKNTNI